MNRDVNFKKKNRKLQGNFDSKKRNFINLYMSSKRNVSRSERESVGKNESSTITLGITCVFTSPAHLEL